MENQYCSNSFQKVFECEQLYKRWCNVSKSDWQKVHLLQMLKPLNFIEFSIKDVRAHCYSASLLRTLFIKHARATSFSSACTESKIQQKHRASDLGVNLVCQYFCWMLGDPHFFFGRSLPFLILSIILKNKKICAWEVLIISHNTSQIGSNWYMDTGVRDLEVAFLKANSAWFDDKCSKDLSNRPIYAVLNTHNLRMILQLKYMPIVMYPARITSCDWKS